MYAEIVLFERFLHFKYFINLLFISCLLFNNHYIIKNWHNCYYEKKGNKEYCINDEIPFNIPNNWIWTRLNNITTNISTKNYQIYQKEIKNSGKYPVVSQSSNLIEGYSDNNNKVLKIDFPIIIFGDHTKCLKYIDFDFIVGADGVKIIKAINFNTKFLYYLLSFIKINMINRGYSRHFQFISKHLLPIPPINEQKRILNFLIKIDVLFNKINDNIVSINNLSKQIKLKLLTDIFGENSSYKSYYKNYLLKDISNIVMGQSISSNKIISKYVEEKDYLEFHQGKLNFGKYLLGKSNKYTKNYKKTAVRGSILLSVRAPVGALNFTDRSIAIGRGLCSISVNQNIVLNQYLYFYLQYLIPYFKRNSTGSTFQAITIELIKNCVIKIPPLEKQKNIINYLLNSFKLIDTMNS